MEPRRSRPKFFNPFTERKRVSSYIPLYLGFFRTMPLHSWSLGTTEKVLGYAALNPSLFGFPEKPCCIVNTAYFLPGHRSLQRGVFAFGHERGCKGIIIPPSCNGASFDTVDAKLVEPLFRWNPSIEYVYLSQSCQPAAAHFALLLSRCHCIREVILEGWNDAVAIHRVMMACKRADVLETYSLEDKSMDWENELSVQALCTLIEMHPRLRVVKSHRPYLCDWHKATLQSRCRHNVALVPFGCSYLWMHQMLFLAVMCIPAYVVYRLVRWYCRGWTTENYERFWGVVAFVVVLLWLIGLDVLQWKRRGRGWVHLQVPLILLKRRIDILMNVHQTSLARL